MSARHPVSTAAVSSEEGGGTAPAGRKAPRASPKKPVRAAAKSAAGSIDRQATEMLDRIRMRDKELTVRLNALLTRLG
jgi:hypothetical protein